MAETKVTDGPWWADPDERPGMEWNIHIVSRPDPSLRVCFMSDSLSSGANANLIVSSVNACFEINPTNPTAVAGEIVEAFEILQSIQAGDFAVSFPDADRIEALLTRIQNNGGSDGA